MVWVLHESLQGREGGETPPKYMLMISSALLKVFYL